VGRERQWDVLLLGPLVVLEEGRRVELGGRMQRTLLAILLMHRGDVVSVDRLVDDLWASAPPPGAAKTLQVYVSRLRSSLGGDAVAHEGGGYALRLPSGAVDADRFEELYDLGREQRKRGESSAAARTLREALVLWRGAPLDELANNTSAAAEIARLESLHLAALEERIGVDLELGRHAVLIPELERLVREQPFREGLRAQLMLALYRSGCQADALDTYRQGRQLLRDELGLVPGPELQELERAILNQEPALRAPPRAPPPRPRRLRRAGVFASAGGLLLVAAAASAFFIARENGRTAGLTLAAPDSLAEIDPSSNRLVAEVPIGSAPVAVAVGAQSTWVANAGDQTIARVDPVTRQVMDRVGLGRIPSQIAFGAGGLWVASAVGRRGVVQIVDPARASVVSTRTIRVGAGRGDDLFAPPTPSALAAGAGNVWANNLHANISRVAPGAPGVTTHTLAVSHSVDGIAVGENAVWVASGADDRVLRIDPPTGTVVAEIPIAATSAARVASPYGIAVGYGSVWVTDALSNTVSEIDPKLNAVTATIRVGTRPTRIAVGEGAIWVVNAGDGTVTRIDPRRHVATATIEVGRALTGIAAGLGGVWVTVAGGTPAEGGRAVMAPVRSLPLSSCSPIVHGKGTPDVLIASELPTFLGEASPDPVIADMRAAVLDVLNRHGFRAGRYRLGYEACDDSSAGAGPMPERCAVNARGYALNPSVVGVLGTYTSGCAEIELPILNAARAGPVPMISPTNTYVGLTHAGPATAADEPDRYYPTGSRNYVRLRAPDDDQSAAIALFLRRVGRTRVYLLDDGQGTGFAGASYVARAARSLGLPIVGRSSWSMSAHDYRSLARRIERAGVDAVVLSGCVCANGLRLVTDLRASLGSGPTIVGTDNFSDSGDEFRTAFGRLGLMVASAGRAPETMPAEGRRLLARVAVHRDADDVDADVAYAAEAAELLIAAIASSDGTRASVARALTATHLRDSLIGPIAFDANGDPNPSPITIYRVDATVSQRSHRTPQGLVPERTYEPPASLVR
jgi:YVTN family beta-propeller protein